MDNHPIPRQITTFEFKLIGFLTLKQFGYLAIFAIIGTLLFFAIPVSIVNIVIGGAVAAIGAAFAFIPINERPLDVFISNLIKKLFTPSQYYYMKQNQPPDFLKNIVTYSSPQIVESHLDAKNKLASYLGSKKGNHDDLSKKKSVMALVQSNDLHVKNPDYLKSDTEENTTSLPDDHRNPFLFGLVKSNKNIPLPGILIYIKDNTDRVVRILKTNHNGVFATYHPFNSGIYILSAKDLGQKFFFDTMEIPVKEKNDEQISIISREII